MESEEQTGSAKTSLQMATGRLNCLFFPLVVWMIGGGLLAAKASGKPAVFAWVAIVLVFYVWRSARLACFFDQEGVRVRNIWRSYSLRWSEIAGWDVVSGQAWPPVVMRFGGGVIQLRTTDGRRIPVLASARSAGASQPTALYARRLAAAAPPEQGLGYPGSLNRLFGGLEQAAAAHGVAAPSRPANYDRFAGGEPFVIGETDSLPPRPGDAG